MLQSVNVPVSRNIKYVNMVYTNKAISLNNQSRRSDYLMRTLCAHVTQHQCIGSYYSTYLLYGFLYQIIKHYYSIAVLPCLAVHDEFTLDLMHLTGTGAFIPTCPLSPFMLLHDLSCGKKTNQICILKNNYS